MPWGAAVQHEGVRRLALALALAACGGGSSAAPDAGAVADAGPDAARPGGQAGRPSARRAVPMVVDPLRGDVVLFGGWGVDGPGMAFAGLGDFWLWRGGAWRPGASPALPGPRGSYSAVWDEARGAVFLMGGSSGGEQEGVRVQNALADSWTWDGAAWTSQPHAERLGARVDHALAYDAARGQVVLFGGVRVVFRSETWIWDGAAWTEREVVGPTSRAYLTMAYDEVRGQVVLFGGFDHLNVLGDTWTWDGTAWTERHPAASPPARRSHGMAFDPVRQQVLLFGGTPDGEAEEEGGPGATNANDDTWAWDGETWQRLEPAHRPPARRSFAFAADRAGRRVLLFGGIHGNSPYDTGAVMFDDQWHWDGSDWRQGW